MRVWCASALDMVETAKKGTTERARMNISVITTKEAPKNVFINSKAYGLCLG